MGFKFLLGSVSASCFPHISSVLPQVEVIWCITHTHTHIGVRRWTPLVFCEFVSEWAWGRAPETISHAGPLPCDAAITQSMSVTSCLQQPEAGAATAGHPPASSPATTLPKPSGKHRSLGRSGAQVWVSPCLQGGGGLGGAGAAALQGIMTTTTLLITLHHYIHG